jgi:hypothetical protein
MVSLWGWAVVRTLELVLPHINVGRRLHHIRRKVVDHGEWRSVYLASPDSLETYYSRQSRGRKIDAARSGETFGRGPLSFLIRISPSSA